MPKVKKPEAIAPGPENLWTESEAELLQRVQDGQNAAYALQGFRQVHAEMKVELAEQFFNLPSSYYQKVDNYRDLVLKLKRRLLDEFLTRLEIKKSEGQDANEEYEARTLGGEETE